MKGALTGTTYFKKGPPVEAGVVVGECHECGGGALAVASGGVGVAGTAIGVYQLADTHNKDEAQNEKDKASTEVVKLVTERREALQTAEKDLKDAKDANSPTEQVQEKQAEVDHLPRNFRTRDIREDYNDGNGILQT